MIQRIQSIFLALVFLISGGSILFESLWIDSKNTSVYAIDNTIVFAAFAVSALLAIGSLFSFKNRKSQFVINRINIIINFFLLGFFVYQSLTVSGEISVSEKGIGMFLPIISIVLLAFANKAIKKDEHLVKSVDRLR